MALLLLVERTDGPLDRAVVLRHQAALEHVVLELLVDLVKLGGDQVGDRLVITGGALEHRVAALPDRQARAVILEEIADRRLGALVEADLAVGVGTRHHEAGEAEVVVDPELVQAEQVVGTLWPVARHRVGAQAAHCGVEALGAALLVGEAGVDRQLVGRREACCHPGLGGVVAVGVLLVARTDVVDEAAVGADIEVATQRQHVGDDRQVDHAADVVAALAVLGVGAVDLGIAEHLAGIGLGGDEAHRARHRAGTVQRALRSAQNLDALEVIDLEVGGLALDRDRRVVEVDCDQRTVGRVGGRVAAGGEAAHVELVEARRPFRDRQATA